MSAGTLRSGDRTGPHELTLDAEMGAAFAEATQDGNPCYLDGSDLPPTAIATQSYRIQFAAMVDLVPEAIFSGARSGVHGEHELLLHRRVVPGEPLHTVVETHSARPSRGNLRITLLHQTYDAEDRLVAEQWWTTVMLGTTAAPTGPDRSDPGGNQFDRGHPTAEEVIPIDTDMAHRYAEVSGDFSGHHFDVAAARRSGYERPFLHGLCTMALCARAVVHTVGRDDPRRLRRLAVRFASPAFLGEDLTVRIYAVGEVDRYALEATCGEDVVIRNGLAELRPIS